MIEKNDHGFYASPDGTRDFIRTLYPTFEEAVSALRSYTGIEDIPIDWQEWQHEASFGQSPETQLETFRKSIDNLDAILLHTLAERFKVTQAVGRLKAEHNMPPADKAREARQIERLQELAVESALDPVFAEKFLNFIVAEVIRHHEQIRGD